MVQSILGGINQETSQRELLDTLLLVLIEQFAKTPRVDAAQRLLVSLAEVNPTVNIAATQTLTALTRLENMGRSARPADMIPLHMSNAGTMHIYDNIRIT